MQPVVPRNRRSPLPPSPEVNPLSFRRGVIDSTEARARDGDVQRGVKLCASFSSLCFVLTLCSRSQADLLKIAYTGNLHIKAADAAKIGETAKIVGQAEAMLSLGSGAI